MQAYTPAVRLKVTSKENKPILTNNHSHNHSHNHINKNDRNNNNNNKNNNINKNDNNKNNYKFCSIGLSVAKSPL